MRSLPIRFSGLILLLSKALFLNTGTFSTTLTQVKQAGTAYLTYFVQYYAFNIGAVKRKQTLHTNTVAYFTYCKRGGSAGALALDHIAFKALDTLFITFNNFIINSDVVTSFKLGVLPYRGKLFVHKAESLLVHG